MFILGFVINGIFILRPFENADEFTGEPENTGQSQLL